MALLFVLAQMGCALAATPGDLFRKKMADMKTHCYNRRLSPNETTCNILTLKVEDPLATATGRLAQSITLPTTVAPKSYLPGMTSDAYFNELCREAGEFIFSTVNDVEGVMQVRPRKIAVYEMLEHLYAMEDPYGYREWEARNPELFYVGPNAYRFFEKPIKDDEPFAAVSRYSGYDGKDRKTMQKEVQVRPSSRYGVIWRGIARANDREMGIAGGELIVVELNTMQVLGVKRGFAYTGDTYPAPIVLWRGASVCAGENAALFASREFVKKVLIPRAR